MVVAKKWIALLRVGLAMLGEINGANLENDGRIGYHERCASKHSEAVLVTLEQYLERRIDR